MKNEMTDVTFFIFFVDNKNNNSWNGNIET